MKDRLNLKEYISRQPIVNLLNYAPLIFREKHLKISGASFLEKKVQAYCYSTYYTKGKGCSAVRGSLYGILGSTAWLYVSVSKGGKSYSGWYPAAYFY